MTAVHPGLAALGQRLRAVADVVLPDPPVETGEVAADAGALLTALVAMARTERRADLVWLLITAASGQFPLSDDVEDLVRDLDLAQDATEAEIHLLRHARDAVTEHGEVSLPLRVVTDAVVVDVNFSAQNDMHTGIQRVTREVCPRWNRSHDLLLTGWNSNETAMRSLTDREEAKVLAWHGRGGSDPVARPDDDDAAAVGPVSIVPWRSTVVLPEVTQGRTSLPLAALAQYSGNAVVAIGYDAIPVVSADVRPALEPNGYLKYLTVIKYAQRVAGISTSAAAEFRGFADAVRAQGLPGPVVTEVMLGAEVPADPNPTARTTALAPTIVCVGSHEPHKNHLAVLHAAELLWREGLVFSLTFVGGRGWDITDFEVRLGALVAAGRDVTNLGSVSDEELWALYRHARFTVFPSLHEGFGLPVAESLACGTPVVTTRYGSTGEIAERGGCLLIDPRDDHDLARAMRLLLTDGDMYSTLEKQAAVSVGRSWDDYADDLWAFLVEKEVRLA